MSWAWRSQEDLQPPYIGYYYGLLKVLKCSSTLSALSAWAPKSYRTVVPPIPIPARADSPLRPQIILFWLFYNTIPPSPRRRPDVSSYGCIMLLTSTTRRYRRADRLSLLARPVMRACSSCATQHVICETSPEVDACVECYRHNRRCSLAPNDTEIRK
jgi:hypothetical protein